MIYGEHLHAEEQAQPPHCLTCARRASHEVFDVRGNSCGCFCLRCGQRKLAVLERLEAAFPIKKEVS
jgi:hypothetical protein